MRPAVHHLSISAVRGDALFVSALQPSGKPSAGQVREAVAGTVREFGSRGCAERVAQEFGDHPDTAVARMRWARQVVAETFGGRGLAVTRARVSGESFAAHAGCAA